MSDFPNKSAKYDSGMKLMPIHFSWYSKLPESYQSAPLASCCQHREQLVFGVRKQLPIFSVFVFVQQSEDSRTQFSLSTVCSLGLNSSLEGWQHKLLSTKLLCQTPFLINF